MNEKTLRELNIRFTSIGHARADVDREKLTRDFRRALQDKLDWGFIDLDELMSWAEHLRNEYAPLSRGSSMA